MNQLQVQNKLQKPVLLEFREQQFKDFKAKLLKAQSQAQKHIDKISAINGIVFDTEILFDLLLSKGEMVEQALEQSVIDDLSKAGIKSESIRKEATKADLITFYNYQRSMLPMESELVTYLSVKDGKVTILEEALKKAEQGFKYEVKTKRGLEVYEAHKRMVDAMNELIDLVPAVNTGNIQRWVFAPYGGKHLSQPLMTYDKL